MSYLFFDIDGTLTNKNHQVEEKAVKAVHRAIEAGHQCFFCTGRCYGMVEEMNMFHIHHAVVTNGAAVVIEGKEIISHPIAQDVAIKTIDLAESLGAGIQILDIENGYQNKKTHDKFRKDFGSFEKDDPETVFKRRHMLTFNDYRNTPILKMDVVFDDDDKALTFVKEMDDSLQYIPAGGYLKDGGMMYGEIVLKNVSKGTGIKEALDYLKADIKDSYGFGDSNNDLGMLKTVAHAIVIEPGTKDINQYADYITDLPENDGILEALEHYHLI